MYHAGLVSISFRDLTPEQIIDAAAAAGLTWVEWGSKPHAPWDDPPRLEQIARLQAEKGLFCSSYGTYFRIGVQAADELPAYIRAAKILGTDILRLWCGDKSAVQYTPAEQEVLFSQCRQLANMAEREGVTLCMECHNDTFTDRAEAALQLMQAVDSPAFRMYYQPNQYKTLEENLVYARLLAPYTRHLHVFNWNGDTRLPLKDAIGQWQEYVSCFPGDRALLLEFMPDGRVESLPNEAAALRKIIGGTV